MKSRLMKIISFIFIAFTLVACSGNTATRFSQSKSADSGNIAVKMDTKHKTATEIFSNQAQQSKQDMIQNPSPRMVIYNADLQLEVKNLKTVQTDISQLADEMGGYIVNQEMANEQNERISGSLTARIPQQNFQTFMSKVISLGVRVEHQNVTGQDVTEEYVDLKARLTSKQVVEKRLIQFMNNAKDTKDLLEISNELANVQEEIETLTGKIKYLENQTALSTITIHLYENKVVVPTLEHDQLNTWEKTKKLFMNSINIIMTVFSGLVVFLFGSLPILVLIGMISLLAIIVTKKRRNKRHQK